MATHNTYLIIGAGIAGLTAATNIRSLDKESSITLINGEPYPPYKRTNLSKFFAQGFSEEDFTLATPKDLREFYGIEIARDTITQIDYEAKR
ncbi:MAG: FAD/NAD(P)-binding oxidoreductase, partial [Spirochaetota bacterium]